MKLSDLVLQPAVMPVLHLAISQRGSFDDDFHFHLAENASIGWKEGRKEGNLLIPGSQLG